MPVLDFRTERFKLRLKRFQHIEDSLSLLAEHLGYCQDECWSLFMGQTVIEVFDSMEKNHNMVVYYGCFLEEDLNCRIDDIHSELIALRAILGLDILGDS